MNCVSSIMVLFIVLKKAQHKQHIYHYSTYIVNCYRCYKQVF